MAETPESLTAHIQRTVSLLEELASVEAERARLALALDEARRRSADLASLYVATHRLHSTLDRGRVLQAIEEIVASLLGCEELAVFELIGTPAVLAPVLRAGIPAEQIGIIQLGEGVIGRSVAAGELWLAEQGEGKNDQLTACVPLKVDGQVTGAIALFGLLEHKGRLESADRELLEVLSTHAATALMATRLRAETLGATRA